MNKRVLEALLSSGERLLDGLPVGTRVEWEDQWGEVRYTGVVDRDQTNGTFLTVIDVRLAAGSYETFMGAAHKVSLMEV